MCFQKFLHPLEKNDIVKGDRFADKAVYSITDQGCAYFEQLMASSAQTNREYAAAYAGIPLVGRTIFDQQQLLYRALLEWLDAFARQFKEG